VKTVLLRVYINDDLSIDRGVPRAGSQAALQRLQDAVATLNEHVGYDALRVEMLDAQP
jgi:hypothetical protein